MTRQTVAKYMHSDSVRSWKHQLTLEVKPM